MSLLDSLLFLFNIKTPLINNRAELYTLLASTSYNKRTAMLCKIMSLNPEALRYATQEDKDNQAGVIVTVKFDGAP